jgi:hypothetical protein
MSGEAQGGEHTLFNHAEPSLSVETIRDGRIQHLVYCCPQVIKNHAPALQIYQAKLKRKSTGFSSMPSVFSALKL